MTGAAERRTLSGRLVQAGLVALAVAAVFVLLYLSRNVILPFVMALFLTYLLRPLVRALSSEGRWRVPRPVAAFLALVAFLGLLVIVVLALAPILAAETNQLVRAIFSTGGEQSLVARRISDTLQYWRQVLYGTGVFPPEVARQLDSQASDFVNGFGARLAKGITRSVMLFPRFLVLVAVPLLAFYMLADGERMARETRGFLPTSTYREGAADWSASSSAAWWRWDSG